jgi:acylpyruvate hydrolase
MRLVTVRIPGGGTVACRLDEPDSPAATAVEISGPEGRIRDVGALLATSGWRELAETAAGTGHRLDEVSLAPVVPAPTKVVCVGLNYRTHILEMGRDLPEHPTLFAKFTETLTGPADDIVAPVEDTALDWEAELTVVMGSTCRRISESEAIAAIAGYTVANDVSLRSWQFRTKEWLQGKMWEASTPVGPALVTADEWQPGPTVSTTVNGEKMQEATTGDLLFGPAALVAYISTMITLNPGDLILTGTPGGVGHAHKPPRYLVPGDLVETSIEGLGTLVNRIVSSPSAGAVTV